MTDVLPGQIWRLWVHDDSMQETIKITRVHLPYAEGITEDGMPCVVGIDRLRESGTLVEDYHMPFERRGTT